MLGRGVEIKAEGNGGQTGMCWDTMLGVGTSADRKYGDS